MRRDTKLPDNLTEYLPANERYLPARTVLDRYGISEMTLWRWVHSKTSGFPKPFYMERRRYFRLSEVLAYEDKQRRAVA